MGDPPPLKLGDLREILIRQVVSVWLAGHLFVCSFSRASVGGWPQATVGRAGATFHRGWKRRVEGEETGADKPVAAL